MKITVYTIADELCFAISVAKNGDAINQSRPDLKFLSETVIHGVKTLVLVYS